MANSNNIQKVYTDVNEGLLGLAKKRKRVLIFQKVMWLITGGYILLVVLQYAHYFLPNEHNAVFDWARRIESSSPYANLYPFVGLCILLYPTIYLFTYFLQKFNLLEFDIYSRMVKGLFPTYEFTHEGQLSIAKIKESKLFSWIKTGTTVATYGQIRVVEKGLKINIADIGVKEENLKNKTITTLLNIPGLNVLVMLYQYVLKNIFTTKIVSNNYFTFRGMYFWTSFNKKMNGKTVIISNTVKSKLDRWSSFNFKEEEKIRLENIEFTNLFEVYGTDQIEARYILTPSLMEKIVTLKQRFNRDIMLSFNSNNMYLTVENQDGLFSFPSKQINSIDLLVELENQIDVAINVAKDLKLVD